MGKSQTAHAGPKLAAAHRAAPPKLARPAAAPRGTARLSLAHRGAPCSNMAGGALLGCLPPPA
eukprot:396593-Prymnesium_polylepis.1